MVAARLARAILLLLTAGACAPLALPDAARVAPGPIEPPVAAAFVAAHAAVRASQALRLSPLYAPEATRRERDPAAPDGLWLAAAPRLRFELVASLHDRRGFGHALYVARPKARPGPTTLWRVDLDPAGRVVWAEPVRLLGARVRITAPDDGVRVVDEAGDGYAAVPVRDGRAFRFLITNADGTATDDPWSFRQPFDLFDEGGHAREVPPLSTDDPELDSGLRALLRDYLDGLR